MKLFLAPRNWRLSVQSSTSRSIAIAPTQSASIAVVDRNPAHSQSAIAASNAGGTANGGIVLSGICVIAVPAILVFGILCYRKCRKVVRQRQVCMLEKLWQISSTEPQR